MKITNLFRMSSDKGRTCAFTGHRPQNLPFRFNENDDRCIALKQKLRDCIVQLIEQEGVRHFISGMAIGVDMYAAEIVLELKAEYSAVPSGSAGEAHRNTAENDAHHRAARVAYRCHRLLRMV